MIPTPSELVQLGVAGMAIFAMVIVVVFMVRHRDRDTRVAMQSLLLQGHEREKALSFTLEKSREDRIRLEGILERNTSVIEKNTELNARLVTMIDFRLREV